MTQFFKNRYGLLACSIISLGLGAPTLSMAQQTVPAELNVSMPAENILGTPVQSQQVLAQQNPILQPQKENVSPNIDDIALDVQSLDEPLSPMELELEPVLMAKSQEELEEEIRRDAFDAALTGLFPLRPDQIREVLRQYDETETAVKTPIAGIPKPEISGKTASLDPGVDPITINTAYGHITTLNILDITGAPWPVGSVAWAGNFEVSPPEEGGHHIRIMPMDKHAYGNIVVNFLNLKTSVTFTLRTGNETVDYRLDIRIPEYGPFAKASIIDAGGSQFSAGDTRVTAVLDGTPPSGAQKMNVSGVDGRTSAYKLGGSVYVRTPLTLLSPCWKSSASYADGMHVYVLDDTPVLLLSDQGNFFRAHLKKGEDIFDE